MLKHNRILALDVGASAIKLAEFNPLPEGSLELSRFGVRPLEIDPSDPDGRVVDLSMTLREVMRERQIRPGPALLTVSGHQVFSRFVKLPPVEAEKIARIVAYEAQQHVPFPIEEVVWDYQLVGVNETDLDVMIAAVKGEIIETVTDAVEEAGLRPELVDVAPLALYNAARFTGAYEQDCTLLVDMGARSTDLIFLEQGRIFIRSIPVAGNMITQRLARELQAPFEEAEDLKRQYGWAGPGAAGLGHEDGIRNRVGHVVRTVMSRIYTEINRSVNFYRGQQGGEKVRRLVLAGGTSAIPGTDDFFRDKLGIPVEPFNPFETIAVAADVDVEEIARHVRVLGQVVGLGLRGILTCPIEINLAPPRIQAAREKRKRRPIWVIAGAGVVLVLMTWCGYFYQMADLAGERHLVVRTNVQRLQANQRKLAVAHQALADVIEQIELLQSYGPNRERWNRILTEIRTQLPEGLWLDAIVPVGDGRPAEPEPEPPPRGRAGRRGARAEAPPVDPAAPSSRICFLELAGHGYLDRIQRWDTVRDFNAALQASPLFSDETEITWQPVPTEVLLDFGMRVVLEEPIPQ